MAVLKPLEYLEKYEDFNITLLNVTSNGIIDINDLINNINNNTCLISIMYVNNEIGVIQPIDEIGKIAKKNNILFHTDAAQAYGKIHINMDNIDLLSLSGHKIYGPKGIGALYMKKNTPFEPLFFGGGQEMSIRPGTVATYQCVGLGKAAEIALEEMDDDAERILFLRNLFLEKISILSDYIINGDLYNRIHGNINISFLYIDGKDLINILKDKLAISMSSACSSSTSKSHVINSIYNVNNNIYEIYANLRISIGKYTTKKDIYIAIDSIINAVNYLRNTKNVSKKECKNQSLFNAFKTK
eukprot:GHVL01017160.1.p2 GENE.GHVL01017160.1~~GHVL01017160.1.p2  ORF type:complete len:300 (-),score=98.13 GHVL01017160.1:2201-3100(-)